MSEFTTSYRRIEAYKLSKPKSMLRALLRKKIIQFSNSLMSNDLVTNRVHFLYIHHVFADEEELFRELIENLLEHYSFDSHSNTIDGLKTKQLERPTVSLSSDDGFKNNLVAARILNEYNIEACFFICPGLVDYNVYRKNLSFNQTRMKLPPIEYLTWKEVEELQKLGHEIGNHTMTHVNIADTESEQLHYEIGKAKEILERSCGTIKHFAWPYGRNFHFSEEGRAIVRVTGHSSCASAERGSYSLDHNVDPMSIQRNVVIPYDWKWELPYFIKEHAK